MRRRCAPGPGGPYPKNALPASEVFDQDTTSRLVLITCGGTFDWATRHYSDNVVVYALPAPY